MKTTLSPGVPGGRQIFPNKKRYIMSIMVSGLTSWVSRFSKSQMNFFKCSQAPVVTSQELSPYLPLDTNEQPALSWE